MENIVELKEIFRVYPNGVIANKKVNFNIKQGEIHALVGENGAGKSTLMKILFGMESPTEGDILIKGKKVKMNSSHDAIKLGIGMVHQHFKLAPSLTVFENIVLGNEIKKFGIFLDKNKAIETTKKLSEKYNLPINPNAKIVDLTVSQKQKVEILKALYRGADILILDEPTAVLTPQEIDQLFEQLKELKKLGHTIVFISHKLKEIKNICDRLTIMRDGVTVGVHSVADVTTDEISRLMVGRDVTLDFHKKPVELGKTLLDVNGVTFINDIGKKAVNDVSFKLKAGEIFGIAGIDGNGQSELVEIITGLSKYSEGEILIDNVEIKNFKPDQIRNLGLSHIPEDRMHTGIAPNLSIKENIIAVEKKGNSFTKKVFINKKRSEDYAKLIVNDFNVKTSSIDTKINSLSGGNIQKVIIGREFALGNKLLIINQPTRGVDVGAIEFIREKIIKMREEGYGILLVSADLNEVLSLSDKLIIMNSGSVAGFFDNVAEVSEFEVGLYMLGEKKQTDEEVRRAYNV